MLEGMLLPVCLTFAESIHCKNIVFCESSPDRRGNWGSCCFTVTVGSWLADRKLITVGPRIRDHKGA